MNNNDNKKKYNSDDNDGDDNNLILSVKASVKPKNASKIYPLCNHSLHFDGCSKGNPGPAGIGAVLYEKSDEMWGGSKYIGSNKTNNQAEYEALIFGLEHALEYGIKHLLVFGDSLLVIQQINKIYKVKNKGLIELYNKIVILTNQFQYIEFIHVYRDKNTRADELANLALVLDFDKVR